MFEQFAEEWFGQVRLQIKPKNGFFYPMRELAGTFLYHTHIGTNNIVRYDTEQEARAFLSGKYGQFNLQMGDA